MLLLQTNKLLCGLERKTNSITSPENANSVPVGFATLLHKRPPVSTASAFLFQENDSLTNAEDNALYGFVENAVNPSFMGGRVWLPVILLVYYNLFWMLN